MLQLRESTIARLGLVALALVEWRHAALLVWNGLLPMHPFAIGLLLTLYLTSFALLLQAIAKKEPTAASTTWLVGPVLLVLLAFGYQDAIHKLQSDAYPSTDGHVYMDVAARLILQGKNPYAHSLLEAFRIYQMPLRQATPLLDGDFSDRVAYPSLSFLALVPFALLHVPTYLVYALCFVASLLLLVRQAPWWARAIVFALFARDETWLLMTFGGVTDSVWALCLLGAVLAWHRPPLMAVLVGLACAQKQHPWFFVPFLLVRLCAEHDAKPWEGAPRRFLITIATVFAVLNVPFLLWGPKVWIVGIVEPLVAPMIQLSEGFTALGMTGYVSVPRPITSILFWLLFAYAVWVYRRHTDALRAWCWFLPAVVLWFGYRALMSYWYFNALLVVGVLLTPAGPAIRDMTRSTSPAIRAGLAYAAVLLAVCVGCAFLPPAFEATVEGPLDTWDTHVFRVHVRVTNRTSHDSFPRFSVQGSGLQPLQWTVDVGARLAPGATGDFLVRAPRPSNNFEITGGARLAISEGSDPPRAFVGIPADLSINRLDRVPNDRFVYHDTRTEMPFGWTVDSSDGAARVEELPGLEADARLALVFEPRTQELDPATVTGACFPGQKLEATKVESRFVDVLTTMDLPLADMAFHVKVPATANRAPWDELYGLHVAVAGWQGYVLFGTADRGVLPSGAPWVGVAAPRDVWTKTTFSLAKLLESLGAPLESRRFTFSRMPEMDYPATPIQVGVFASMPASRTGRLEVGRFDQALDDRNENELVARSLRSSADLAVWHGSRELENKNPSHAAHILEPAVAESPSRERWILLGEAELHAGRVTDSIAAYERSLAIASSSEAEKGLGRALLGARRPRDAIPHLERAASQFAETEKRRPRIHYFDALAGLVVATAQAGDCVASLAWAKAATAESTPFPVPVTPECPLQGSSAPVP